MTKSIEEQANEAWNKLLIEYKYKDEFTHTRHLYYTSGYQGGAKARDAQLMLVVNELREALKFTIEESGTSTNYNLKCRNSITKADQMLKEMGMK